MSYTLRDVSTAALLKALRSFTSYDSYEDEPRDEVYISRRPCRLPDGSEGFDVIYATPEAVRHELRSRPHLPGKVEAKTLRRLMSQTGWTEEQLRAHPRFGMELADAQFPNRRVVSGEWATRMAKHYGEHFGRLFKVVA